MGGWAVQLAKKHYKLHVVATAGPKNQAFLKVPTRWPPHGGVAASVK